MMRRYGRLTGVALLAMPTLIAAMEPDPLGGRYGHEFSEPAYAAVWEVRRVGAGWQAGTVADDTYSAAHEMSPAARRAFWEKMGWLAATSTEADCVTWGEAPLSLTDMLEGKPVATGPDAFGSDLVCHVPAHVRKDIDWLADSSEDWFFYNPVAGVMEVRRVP